MIQNAHVYFSALYDLTVIAASTGGEGVDLLTLTTGSLAESAEMVAYHMGRAWDSV